MSPFSHIAAVMFDLYGTVVAYGDVATGTRQGWEAIYDVMQRLGAAVPYAEYEAHWNVTFPQPLPPEEDVAETPFLSKLLRLFRTYDLPEDLDAAREAATRCLDAWDQHTILPDDAISTLDALGEHFQVALVSNFDHPPHTRAMLNRLDLTSRFDPIVISGELRIEKPDPRIFEYALDTIGCTAEQAMFVGDNIGTDIVGSQYVGCHPVLIDRQGRHRQYDGLRIERLSELLPLLGVSSKDR